MQEIISLADVQGEYRENVFFNKFTDYLTDEGEFSEAQRVQFIAQHNRIRVDGYCGDPLQEAADMHEQLTLRLIILDFNQEQGLQTLTKSTLETLFKHLLKYVDASLQQRFRDSLEPSTPAFGLADLIARRWNRIGKISLYLLTNKVLSSRVDGQPGTEFAGRSVSYNVWDLNRLYTLVASKSKRETMEIQFNGSPLRPLRALLASRPDSPDPVYLAAIPGKDLALIYDRWGARLLEQNVRVFLQARNTVNKGIKHTLEREPELFFSFNNGLTATAEGVTTRQTEGGVEIMSLTNLQIVNGGQTTASIYSAYRSGWDLSKVFVQMKLSIVSPEKAVELVPRISEYANSQNKVSSADLFANHPFHTRIEFFSRKLYVPAKQGSFIQTKWFYERARGQYNDEQLYLSRAEKKKFRTVYPKQQVFSKTDLAKYLMLWTDKPYLVNLGAQKNFAQFARRISKQWDEQCELRFNEYYYKKLIAKKIIFDAADRLIPQMEWYEVGGYKSQHVTLMVGLLAEGARNLHRSVDFLRIWKEQGVSDGFLRALAQAADVAHTVLMNPAEGYRNITEWAKQQGCWEEAKNFSIEWDPAWVDELIQPEEEKERIQKSSSEQKEVDSIEGQRIVVYVGPGFWRQVLAWLNSESEGTEKERGCVEVASRMPTRIPTDKQADVLITMMRRIEKNGCPYHLPASSMHAV